MSEDAFERAAGGGVHGDLSRRVRYGSDGLKQGEEGEGERTSVKKDSETSRIFGLGELRSSARREGSRQLRPHKCKSTRTASNDSRHLKRRIKDLDHRRPNIDDLARLDGRLERQRVDGGA